MAKVVSLNSERPQTMALRDVEREHIERALQLGPVFRRGWIRIQEARGEICEVSAERIIRRLGLAR